VEETTVDLGRADGASSRAARRGLVDQIDRWTVLTSVTFALIVAGLAVLIVANAAVFEPKVRDAVEGTRVVRQIHEAMLDEETALRAFLVTGDERFLEPYDRVAPTLPGLGEEAKRRLTSDQTTAGLLVDLRVAQQAWIDGWTERALEAGRRGEVGDAERDRLLGDGNALFADYRAAYQVLSARLVAQRTSALDQQNQALLFTTVVALLITAVMGLVTFRRSRTLRRTTETGLAHLTGRLTAMGSGDLSPRPPLVGPSELEDLDAGLSRTAAALAAARDHEEERSGRVLAQNRHLAQVLRLAREVAGSLNLRYILRGVCDAASSITDRRVVVWLRDDDGDLIPRADTAGPGLEPVGLEPLPVGEGVVGRAARYGRVEGHAAGGLQALPDATGGDELGVPMVVGAEVIGVVQIVGSGVSSLPTSTLEVVEALAV
jgi:CHASE3 domain sensor protein